MRKNRFIRTLFAALLLAALLCPAALAKVVSPGEDYYYLDQAGVLSDALCGEIFFSNQLLDEACGAQFVVVTLKTTGSTAIDDYANELFNTWDIGDSKRQNGFLLLLAIDDDNYYAVPGTGLQTKLTAGRLNAYFDDYLETDFAAKRYESGVKKFFEAVFARIADTYNAEVTTDQGIAAYEAFVRSENEAYEKTQQAKNTRQTTNRGTTSTRQTAQRESSGGGFGFVAVILIVLLILFLLTRKRRQAAAPKVDPVRSTNVPPAFGGTQTQRTTRVNTSSRADSVLPYIIAGEAMKNAQRNAARTMTPPPPPVQPRSATGSRPTVRSVGGMGTRTPSTGASYGGRTSSNNRT